MSKNKLKELENKVRESIQTSNLGILSDYSQDYMNLLTGDILEGDVDKIKTCQGIGIKLAQELEEERNPLLGNFYLKAGSFSERSSLYTCRAAVEMKTTEEKRNNLDKLAELLQDRRTINKERITGSDYSDFFPGKDPSIPRYISENEVYFDVLVAIDKLFGTDYSNTS